jgi:hypothetical protein
VRARRNDDELFEALMEDPEVLLKRRGLVDTVVMESRWASIDFIYQGRHVDKHMRKKVGDKQGLNAFSWLMVTVTTALDVCLPESGVRPLLVEVFVEVLGDRTAEDALRIHLPVNIESWRSMGRVRGLMNVMSHALAKSRQVHVNEQAIPQLNRAERMEMTQFLVWVMSGNGNDFKMISATNFAVAEALARAGVRLRTKGDRTHEMEPVVHYVSDQGDLESNLHHHRAEYDDPVSFPRGLASRAQQISYPNGNPQAMIDSVQAPRSVLQGMLEFWKRGSDAASKVQLYAEAQLPFSADNSEVFYVVEDSDPIVSKFDPMLSMLASKSFPVSSQQVLIALEVFTFTAGVSGDRMEWLETHLSLEFLQRTESSLLRPRAENISILLRYQALVFGFYYTLLGSLVSSEYVQPDTYFRGIWGNGSTTFLAMCTQFSQELRRKAKVSRTHVLYMLATMFNGRQKVFSPKSPSMGLVGVVGSISILAKPLLCITDVPQEIATFVLLDLPVVDLMAVNSDGELYAGTGSGIEFDPKKVETLDISPHGPEKQWSVHAKMGTLFGDGPPGVVMAARCGGRLVGWFNPLAANVQFLSSAYQVERHAEEKDFVDDTVVRGFEIRDEHWQSGIVQRVIDVNPENQIGVVHCRGCPALRYIATGFYVSVGDEVAIATDDIEVALGRVQGQDGGIIVS